MATKPVLYSYFRSSASWRVRIALSLKKIDYDYKPVHLVKDGGFQNTEEYREINPMRQVPSLVIDGHTLTQSIPIIEYLDETVADGPDLLPKDPVLRAKARALAETINSGIQPIQNLSVLNKIGETKVEWAKYWIERGFDNLEKMLEKTAGKYSVGDVVTIADLCLVPQIYNAERFKVPTSNYPNIARIGENLEKLPEFQAAHPSQQPDCPEELR
ncbi:DgyrCDS11645 [Dimorphilus gyrociliatus]|uniref:DgyrCDS11645 n=1 Tax=Dimorphilus gyrociliatus TaxID=2664684 RepID=A0A7I8W404_9ANNE|nr:DgyrCDS11645 [Dimorphilus gyrociliatus]